MTRNITTVSRTRATIQQAEELERLGYGTFSEIVRTAIDRMYQSEIESIVKNQEVGKMKKFYAIHSTDVDRADGSEFITISYTPGHTNMSGEERVNGWLGTTDGHCQTALGEFDEGGARQLLRDHGVEIPDNAPVRYTRYMIGGGDDAEAYNREFAYPYPGPWYDIPADELQWADNPREIVDTRVIPLDGEPLTHLVVVTTIAAGATYGGIRTWYEADYILDDPAAARSLAESLIGKIADTDKLTLHSR